MQKLDKVNDREQSAGPYINHSHGSKGGCHRRGTKANGAQESGRGYLNSALIQNNPEQIHKGECLRSRFGIPPIRFNRLGVLVIT